jgi:hypothetical protein
MLHGQREERARIGALLVSTHNGRSQALTLGALVVLLCPTSAATSVTGTAWWGTRRPASWPRGPGSADQRDRREPAGPAGAAGNPHGRAAGRIHPLPQRLPLSTRLQQAFLLRARALPRATQTRCWSPPPPTPASWPRCCCWPDARAAAPEALEPAERAGLVQVMGSQLVFRHPLVRSAIYQGATFTARQAAHQSLVQTLTGQQQADRRAWHLAAATIGPDERWPRRWSSPASAPGGAVVPRRPRPPWSGPPG